MVDDIAMRFAASTGIGTKEVLPVSVNDLPALMKGFDEAVASTEKKGLAAKNRNEKLSLIKNHDKLKRAGNRKAAIARDETVAQKREINVGKPAGKDYQVIATYGADDLWRSADGATLDFKVSKETQISLDTANADRLKQLATNVKKPKTEDLLRRNSDTVVENKEKAGTSNEKQLVSQVGREKQRYTPDHYRELSCGVVENLKTKKIGLISSSNPNKDEWLLLKGGWDYGETLSVYGQREVLEEAGLGVKVAKKLIKKEDGTSEMTPIPLQQAFSREIVVKEYNMDPEGYKYHVVKLALKRTPEVG